MDKCAPNGVEIPESVVLGSERKKKERRKTLGQLPAYRAASNLRYVIVELMGKSPNKLRKYFDQIMMTTSEICKAIGMAEMSRVSSDRAWYLNCAIVMSYEVENDLTILRKLNLLVSKDFDKKAREVVRGMRAQLVAWRDYTNGEGVTKVS